ncbi:alpha/beta hydrolase [Massilia sp. CCM 9210]|uniref:alpha/beta fold hydrolase n=1 Tax=Massilia scottii TaxID=3057166 RepID=UPI002796821F|nr:alpha/beta hydrolase [Massilia sp. CCM 9210]MDQ1813382.1 alpha/beta hydrolase [Massilia sp. CCM 9210]
MPRFALRMSVFAIAIAAACSASSFAQAPAAPDTQLAFSHANQMVDIGGRRLNLYCSGSGTNTVIFDSPSGMGGWVWHAVQPEVAKHARACVFDRAGLGFSDPAERPNTSQNVVEDLHAALGKAGIAPPYVLVGNSFGGGNIQLFAYRYPSEVKGLVLVEAQHEDETDRMNVVSKGKLKEMSAMLTEYGKACEAQSKIGFVPGSELFTNCTGGFQPQFGRALNAAYLASLTSPAYWRARNAEEEAFETSNAQLRAARRPFGDLPLMVLTRGVSPYAIPGKPQSELNKAAEKENLAIHQEMAALSTRSTHRVVPGAGHVIQADKPQAVTKAVTDLLAQITP